MNTASQNRHVLLQHARTRMFYIRNCDWTSDPARARDFVTVQAALMYSRAQGLPEAEPVNYVFVSDAPRRSSAPV